MPGLEKYSSIIIVASLLAAGNFFFSDTDGSKEEGHEIVIELELAFDPGSLQIDTSYGLFRLTADGYSTPVEPGDAALPFRNVEILVPTDASDIRISTPQVELELFPFQGEIMGIPEPMPVSQAIDNIPVAAREVPTRSLRFMGEGFIRGYRVLSYRFDPVIPAQDTLMIVRRMSVRLSMSGTEGDGEEGREGSAFDRLIRSTVENPRDITRFARSGFQPTGILDEEDVRYVVVTDTSVVGDAFGPLVEWKTRKGVPSKVVEMPFIIANYQGTDQAEKLRNFIRDAVATWNAEYVLLGGDIAVVPYRSCYGYVNSYKGPIEEKYIAADLYFSDLDGTYNSDGDGIWGEVADSVDLHPDVMVGRAPVQTEGQANVFVSKVLEYEMEPCEGFLLNATMAGEYLDASTNSSIANDRISSNLLPSRYNTTTLYDEAYGKAGNLSKSSFISSLNRGAGLVFHSGHSSQSAMGMGSPSGGNYMLYNSDVYLYDTDAGVGILSSIGCITTRFEVNDCIAEKHVLEPDGGSVAFIGNSRYGWYSPGNPATGPSAQYQYAVAEELLKKDHYRLGEHFAIGKNRWAAYSSSDGAARWIQYALNLLGDPEMPVWTVEPGRLNVSYTPLTGTKDVEIDISVQNSTNRPLEGALVCLQQEGYYSYGLTDLDGSISFSFSTNHTQDVNLTVTATGHLPFLANLTVDPVLPEVTFVDIPEATTGDLLPVSCMAFDEFGIGSVTLEYDQMGPGGNMTGTVELTRNQTLWSGSIPVLHDSIEPVHIRAVVKDIPGNMNHTENISVPVKDNDPPMLVDDLTSGNVFTGENARFECIVWDNIGVEEVLLFWHYQGDPVHNYLPMTSKDMIRWSAVVPLEENVSLPVIYSMEIADKSKNRNITKESSMDVLDNIPPLLLADHTDRIGTTSDEMTFSFVAYDNIGVGSAYLEWWFADEGSRVNTSLTKLDNGSFEHVMMIPYYQNSALLYKVHLMDLSGNRYNTQMKEVDLIDDDPPSLGNDLSDDGTETGGYITFSLEASDNVGVDSVSVTYWQGSGRERITSPMKTLHSGTWSHQIKIRDDLDLPVNYQFTVVDGEGNENRSATGEVLVIDRELPLIVSDNSDISAYRGGMLNFSVEAIDNIGIGSVHIEWWWGAEGYRHKVELDNAGVDIWSTSLFLREESYIILNYRIIVSDLSGNALEGNLMEVKIEHPLPADQKPSPAGDPDKDGDMMPDAWEETYGLKVGVDDRFEDPDRDNYPNLYEYQNGTDPMDPSSYPGNEEEEDGPSVLYMIAGGILLLLLLLPVFALVRVHQLKNGKADIGHPNQHHNRSLHPDGSHFRKGPLPDEVKGEI